MECCAILSKRLQYPTAATRSWCPAQPVTELSSLHNLARLRTPTGRLGQAPHGQLRAQAAPATQSAEIHTKTQQPSSAQFALGVSATGHLQSEGNRRRQHNAGSSTSADSDTFQAESLRLLEWPEVCQQVASFTSTAVAAERALGAKLPIASSQKQAEQLLQETAEAQQAYLSLKGIHDLRGLLEAASRNRVLHPVHLDGVASSLEVAATVADRLAEKAGETALFPALQNLGRGIKSALPNLRHSIRHCIEDGRVLDRASDELGRVRCQRRDNMQSLRQSMNEWARKLAAQNVSEEALVVIRRDRLCVPVKSGRQSQLPKGSVTLAVSASGSTVYMEPEPVVTLNNAEAMLRGQEQEEEQAILAGLSQLVKSSTLNLQRLLKAVTALDIATARARHAAWLQALKPVFLSADEAAQTGCIHARAVYHPLLLEPSLPPLKDPPVTEAVNYDASYTASPSGSTAADSMGRASWEPQQPPRQTHGRRGLVKGRAPCPVDLLVPAGVKVVAVTGPNTGGKTASLKAVGLTAIMAKAGLFIPTAHQPFKHDSNSIRCQQHGKQQQQQQEQQQQQQQESQKPDAQLSDEQQQQQLPRMVFFDKVLADVGDSQNLQQSLSTFSGHIRRVRTILQQATPRSLVLLDEVGSGTDPAEGAALAGVLLDRLADTACLTYATTHHAQLKDRPASDPRFINASVEFDLATLKPTYRLLWGEGGLSNALAVAQGLGFDPKVVQRAREIAVKGQDGGSPGARAEELQRSLQQELHDAKQQAATAAATRREAEQTLADLQMQAQEVARQHEAFKNSDAQLQTALTAARTDLDWVVSEIKAGKLSQQEAEECIQQVSDSVPSITAAAAAVQRTKSRGQEDVWGWESARVEAGLEGWTPKVDEPVRLIKLGGRTGKVTGVGSDGQLTVKMGVLSMQVDAADAAPASQSKASRAAAATKASGVTSKKSRDGPPASETSQSNQVVTFQTEANTVDVRGQNSDEALSQVEFGLSSVSASSALFVVHGVGTGKLRSEIHRFLQRSSQVSRFELEKDSGGGCTVVYPK
ncbi:hypothetical protein WJX77_002790 [Trebouxia sp. C0004]